MKRTYRAWGLLAAVLVLAVALGWREIFSPDIGFHLASARWIVSHGAWPCTDPLTFTGVDRPYVDLQWLYQLGLLAANAVGGTRAMTAGNIALTLASFVLMAFRGARRSGRLEVWHAALLLVAAMGNLWEIRPQVCSWLLLNLVLLAAHQKRWVAWPVLMLLWVNLHSLFVLGLVAIGAHAWEFRRERRYWIWAAAALAACLLNPYGLRGLLFPLEQWRELQGASLFKDAVLGIAEFRSPFHLADYTANGACVVLQPLLFMQFYALAALVGTAGLGRRLRSSDAALFILFGWMFLKAQKNFGFFVVATLPATAAGLSLLACRWPRLRVQAVVTAATAVLCTVFGVQLASGWLYAQQRLPYRFGHRFCDQTLPVRACAFMTQRLPTGRLLNALQDGGYAAWATAWPVFIDGRTEAMGETLYRTYLQLREPGALDRAVRRFRFDVALVPIHFQPEWFSYFEPHPDWRRVYADELSLVYVRKGFADAVPTQTAPITGVSPRYTAKEMDAILERAAAGPQPALWKSLRASHYYPLREWRETAVLLACGDDARAVGAGLRGLERGTIRTPPLLHNLAIAFYNTGDRRRAVRCMRAIPPHLREPALARELLQPQG